MKQSKQKKSQVATVGLSAAVLAGAILFVVSGLSLLALLWIALAW